MNGNDTRKEQTQAEIFDSLKDIDRIERLEPRVAPDASDMPNVLN